MFDGWYIANSETKITQDYVFDSYTVLVDRWTYSEFDSNYMEPMDRIDELGDASVPFDFDVHALIFSDNAPGLEAALHKAFEDRKLNMVNTRREFFRVSLDEIKAVVKQNFDQTVDFVDVPLAEQYRQSELMRK